MQIQSYISISFISKGTVTSNRPGIVTVFHARPYGKIIGIKNNLRRKKVHRTNQGSNFLGGSFSNRDKGKSTN